MTTIKTLVIIGGSFNPITNAHIYLGDEVSKMLPDAKILYMPSNLEYISNWKPIEKDEIFSNKNRNKVLQAVFNNLSYNLSNMESTGKLSGRTYDTVKYFSEKFNHIYFVIGSDKLSEIEKWYKFDELMTLTNFIVFSRDNTKFDDIASENLKKYKYKFIEVDMPEKYLGVSSSKVRKAYYNNTLDDVKDDIPYEVYMYLKRDII